MCVAIGLWLTVSDPRSSFSTFRFSVESKGFAVSGGSISSTTTEPTSTSAPGGLSQSDYAQFPEIPSFKNCDSRSLPSLPWPASLDFQLRLDSWSRQALDQRLPAWKQSVRWLCSNGLMSKWRFLLNLIENIGESERIHTCLRDLAGVVQIFTIFPYDDCTQWGSE